MPYSPTIMPSFRILTLGALVATWLLVGTPAGDTLRAQARMAPVFEVDPFWPKPLPDNWVTGSTIGLSVDDRDNVWTIHRPFTVEDNFKAADIMVGDERGRDDEQLAAAPGATPSARTQVPIGKCCHAAPNVLVYDQSGALVKSWGGKGSGYDWPDSEHGITVDHEGHVWLAGNGEKDTQILKFTGDGQFLFQLGKHGVHHGSNDLENFWKPTKLWEDREAGEMYVGDGYGNRRVIVLDRATGAYKRHWGAYGARPSDDPLPVRGPNTPVSKQFNTVHCAIVSNDGFVYVCDRVNDRIQVFRKDGTFVKEAFVDTQTFRSGSVWDLAFSRDPQQTYIYAANGVDQRINILLRSTLEVLTQFGGGGRQPGQWFGVHNIATDSKGNLYTTETYTGARVQRFLYKGLAPVTKQDQGVPWPSTGVVIPKAEVDAYLARAIANRIIDQQIRHVDVGGANVGIGIVHRPAMTRPEPIAEHDLVSELYHVLDGQGTIVLGGDLAGLERRPASQKTVRVQNGPGNGAKEIRDGVSYDVGPGDVLVIPAGTGHQWVKISKDISYLMVRFDPDRIVPLKSAADSRADLRTSGLETPEQAAAEGRRHAELGAHWTPTCTKCPGYVVSRAEFAGYVDRAVTNAVDTPPVRVVSIGKAHVGVRAGAQQTATTPGGVTRTSRAQVFHVMRGAATLRLGAGDDRSVGVGDVVVIPAGTTYQFLRVDQPISWLAVELDVEKVLPLRTER